MQEKVIWSNNSWILNRENQNEVQEDGIEQEQL